MTGTWGNAVELINQYLPDGEQCEDQYVNIVDIESVLCGDIEAPDASPEGFEVDFDDGFDAAETNKRQWVEAGAESEGEVFEVASDVAGTNKRQRVEANKRSLPGGSSTMSNKRQRVDSECEFEEDIEEEAECESEADIEAESEEEAECESEAEAEGESEEEVEGESEAESGDALQGCKTKKGDWKKPWIRLAWVQSPDKYFVMCRELLFQGVRNIMDGSLDRRMWEHAVYALDHHVSFVLDVFKYVLNSLVLQDTGSIAHLDKQSVSKVIASTLSKGSNARIVSEHVDLFQALLEYSDCEGVPTLKSVQFCNTMSTAVGAFTDGLAMKEEQVLALLLKILGKPVVDFISGVGSVAVMKPGFQKLIASVLRCAQYTRECTWTNTLTAPMKKQLISLVGAATGTAVVVRTVRSDMVVARCLIMPFGVLANAPKNLHGGMYVLQQLLSTQEQWDWFGRMYQKARAGNADMANSVLRKAMTSAGQLMLRSNEYDNGTKLVQEAVCMLLCDLAADDGSIALNRKALTLLESLVLPILKLLHCVQFKTRDQKQKAGDGMQQFLVALQEKVLEGDGAGQAGNALDTVMYLLAMLQRMLNCVNTETVMYTVFTGLPAELSQQDMEQDMEQDMTVSLNMAKQLYHFALLQIQHSQQGGERGGERGSSEIVAGTSGKDVAMFHNAGNVLAAAMSLFPTDETRAYFDTAAKNIRLQEDNQTQATKIEELDAQVRALQSQVSDGMQQLQHVQEAAENAQNEINSIQEGVELDKLTLAQTKNLLQTLTVQQSALNTHIETVQKKEAELKTSQDQLTTLMNANKLYSQRNRKITQQYQP